MELLHNGFTLEICEGALPLSTDSMILSDFVRLPRQARVLDLGSGCGTLGLLLCAKDTGCCVTGLELDEKAHLTALENIRRNELHSRMQSICADMNAISRLVEPGSFSVCVSNPPYFSSGPASRNCPAARREELCSLQQLFSCAAWGLKYGGDFYLVHRPERLAELMYHATAAQLEPKRLRLVRHNPGAQVSLVLLQCRKGAKPGLLWEECCLLDGENKPTSQYKQIYHL